MRTFVAILVLSCALASVQARQLQQFRSAADALAGDSRLSTLLAAVKASGISIPDGVTIFAPTNDAFADDSLKEKTGLAAADLLKPENKQLLIDLLKHHVVPSASSGPQVVKQKKIGPVTVSLTAGASTPATGLRSSQMTDGQILPTLLGSSLRVDRNDAELEIDVVGTAEGGKTEDPEDATVQQADIQAGNTIIHIVDEVLVPASGNLRKSG